MFHLPRSLRERLILTYLALVLLAVGGLAAWIASQMRHYAEEQLEHELELEAHLAALLLHEEIQNHLADQTDTTALSNAVEKYLATLNSQLRLNVLDQEFRLILSSDPKIVPNRVEQATPELLAARLKREQHDIRWDEINQEERVFTAAPIINGENIPIAFIQLSFPTAPIKENIHRSWLTLFGVVVLIAVITAGSSILLAGQIAKPLEQLRHVIYKLAQGSLTERAPIRGPQETRDLAIAFNQMADRLEQMIQRQRDFVANAAHELRSPLTSIRLRLELILTELQDDLKAQREYLEHMLEEIDRLRKMTDQLLALSSIECGPHLPPTPVDLAPILYELGEEMVLLFRFKEQNFVLDVPPHLPSIQANPDHLRMIVRNLLDNASKYTQRNGTIQLRASADSNNVYVAVQDNGPGISSSTLPRIFDRFYRGDKSRSRSSEGSSGLGLSIVKELVALNGGKIKVESAVGQGSTFTVCFPIVQEKI